MSDKSVKYKVRFGAKQRSRRRCLDLARTNIDKLWECDAESPVTAVGASVATLTPTATLSTDPDVGDDIVSYCKLFYFFDLLHFVSTYI